MRASVYNCSLIDFCKIYNEAGNITVVENLLNIPFEIKRTFYLYDIPGNSERGGHAHKNLQQCIIAINGSFDVVLDDGICKKTVHLNRSYNALHIIPKIWGNLTNFSSGSVVLVLASDIYDESDYIRDYEEFKKYIQ